MFVVFFFFICFFSLSCDILRQVVRFTLSQYSGFHMFTVCLYPTVLGKAGKLTVICDFKLPESEH